MSITEKDVTYVAELANLELTAEERMRFAQELNSILEYFGRLNELDTENVEAMAQVSERYGPQGGISGDKFAYARREDIVQPCLPHALALQNAPATNGGFFKVPKVIEK